jgi:hypothetical protein
MGLDQGLVVTVNEVEIKLGEALALRGVWPTISSGKPCACCSAGERLA